MAVGDVLGCGPAHQMPGVVEDLLVVDRPGAGELPGPLHGSAEGREIWAQVGVASSSHFHTFRSLCSQLLPTATSALITTGLPRMITGVSMI